MALFAFTVWYHFKKNIIIFWVTSFLLAQEQHGPYKIHKFVGGDTFWVKMGTGKTDGEVMEKNRLSHGIMALSDDIGERIWGLGMWDCKSLYQ